MTKIHPNSFVEGNYYSFTVLKKAFFEEKEYFVLVDEWERKLLLESVHYSSYPIEIGGKIECRVDKINCSGKIFLEPKHPFYEINQSYSFEIVEINETRNKFGNKQLLLKLMGEKQNTALCVCSINKAFSIGESVECKLKRIKKGKLYVQIVETKYQNGEAYSFIIEDKRKLEDDKEYFVLRDKDEQEFILDAAFYGHYKLKIGQKIRCIIIKYSSKAYYFIEPEHPVYKIGESYDFEFVSCEKTYQTEENNSYTVCVKDVFGDDTMFTTYREIDKSRFQSKKIKCKVMGLKKGKALLVSNE